MSRAPLCGRLPASALFYAVTVALLVATVSGSMLLLTHYRSVRVERFLALERARSNARSAIHAAMANAGEPRSTYVQDLFGMGLDSVRIEVLPWGLFDRITATAVVGGRKATIEALAGRRFNNDVVLRLAKGAGTLHMCGDTRILGDVVVPQSDVRRGHIEGKSFSGDRLVEGNIQRSTEQGVKIRELIIERARDFSVNSTFDVLADPVVELAGPAHISGPGHPRGSFFRCTDTLFIAADTDLDMAIVQAPFIVLESGVHGSAQCFAMHGIDVGHDVLLRFPSVLCTVRDPHSANNATIVIGEGSYIQGTVLAIDEIVRGHGMPSIRIAPGATVEGEVCAQGNVEHRGTIHGRFEAEALVLRTSVSSYSGHLLDARLDSALAGSFAAGCAPDDLEPHVLAWRELP